VAVGPTDTADDIMCQVERAQMVGQHRAQAAPLIHSPPAKTVESQKTPEGPLAIEDVLALSKEGLADEIIIARIKRNGKPFSLNIDEILVLRSSGVSQDVIKYLVDPTLPYTPPPPSVTPKTVPPPNSKFPADPLASKVPPEPGIYYLNAASEFLALDLKPIVSYKQSGTMSKFSGGLMKGHVVGSLIGAAAKTQANGWPNHLLLSSRRKGGARRYRFAEFGNGFKQA
jgi:hypothetical protein